ncbi:hypothetical protein L873DRAFT_1817708 [Choiromyces venosus 120613-1]|uniref:RNA ligase domain-containing protein n=1 Tax=Choiromyces venosus 120613-1 TaxID=1336337 RepID=A0A3N4J2K8_9PEZI|nr:hypothetical protein L873DRAFT_1817708 [Choiromyces venosus 120613-1]
METLKLRSQELKTRGPKLAVPAKAEFRGTVKIHGTNATLVFRDCDNLADVTIQSRNKVLVVGLANGDNHGTAEFLAGVPLERLAQLVFGEKKAKFKTMVIAGEFAGKGVMKGVGISQLERFFMVFNICIDDLWQDMGRHPGVALPQYRVFNIMQYKTFRVTINLYTDTTAVEHQMMTYTQDIGHECPVAKALGGSGPGEGIVWTMLVPIRHHNRRILGFKTKDERFLGTAYAPRIPPQTPVANTMIAEESNTPVDDFVNYAVGERRLEQGVEYMMEMGIPLKMENVNRFNRWVINDTLKEESEQMKDLKVHPTFICVKIGNLAGVWFDKYLKSLQAGGKQSQM